MTVGPESGRHPQAPNPEAIRLIHDMISCYHRKSMSKKNPDKTKLTHLLGMPLKDLEEEFVLVAAMQRQIMPDPERAESFGDYDMHGKTVPTAVAGGDYFDFIDLEGRFDLKNKMGLAVADASGHALAAAMLIRDFNTALYMGISFQSYYERDTTSLLFTKMNRRMFRSSQTNQYISAFYGELQKRGILRYVNAGHLNPFVVKKKRVLELDVGGPVLGAFRDFPTPYEVGEIHLDQDDLLVCYTDGIVESTNPDDQEYGYQRLVEITQENRHLEARALFDLVMEDVVRFRAGGEPIDDQTLVVIKKGLPG
jgi:sigma-B regulation protein RsbU (phosphoserine phosphatase)